MDTEQHCTEPNRKTMKKSNPKSKQHCERLGTINPIEATLACIWAMMSGLSRPQAKLIQFKGMFPVVHPMQPAHIHHCPMARSVGRTVPHSASPHCSHLATINALSYPFPTWHKDTIHISSLMTPVTHGIPSLCNSFTNSKGRKDCCILPATYADARPQQPVVVAFGP